MSGSAVGKIVRVEGDGALYYPPGSCLKYQVIGEGTRSPPSI